MAETTIEWATYTFNPWRGCAKVAPECFNCYAEREAIRFPENRGKWGPNGTRVVAAEAQWRKPLKWNHDAEAEQIAYSDHAHRVAADRTIPLGEAPGRPRVFCASLADIFEDWQGPMVDVQGRELWVHDCEPHPEPFRYVPMPHGGPGELLPSERENYENGMFRRLTMADVRYRVFNLILATPYLDWLVLTKRPENIRRLSPKWTTVASTDRKAIGERGPIRIDNLWLGTSAGTQASTNKFVPELLKVADLAAKTFVSAEPLLERVRFDQWIGPKREADLYGGPDFFCNRCGSQWDDGDDHRCADGFGPWLDLIIAGGESGTGARPCSLHDLRSIVTQTSGTSTKCFVKQLGALPYDGEPGYMIPLRGGVVDHVKHKKGGDPAEWPEDLRVREMPTEAGR